MATAGDGVTTYQSGGVGGKFRKRPIRRSAQATPYDRPPTALRNNSPSLFSKLVNPASRLIYAGADRLFGVFRKRLPPIPVQRLPGTSEEPRNGSQEADPNSALKNSTVVLEPSTDEGGNLASISAATEISDLENMLKQKTFTRSEIERLTALLHSRTTESDVREGDRAKLLNTTSHGLRLEASTSGTLNKHLEERETENFHVPISTPVVNSRAFEDDVATPAELAKAYMGTRPAQLSPLTLRSSSQPPRQDSVLLNNTTTINKTPIASLAPKTAATFKTFENGLTTPRSRGRSALYNMARTPYYRGPSTLSQKGVASPYAWELEGSSRMAAKRRSSALDDIGSGGPMRRIRQKANLISHKGELGSSQKLLLRNEPEPKGSKAVEENGETSKRNNLSYGSVPTESSKMASKIFEQLDRMSPKEKPSGSRLAGTTEKIESPKFLSSFQDNKTSGGQHSLLLSDARESTSQSNNAVSLINGNCTEQVKGKAPIATNAGPTSMYQKKQAFLMSAHEDSLDLDDDNHSNGHVSIPLALGENKKPGTSVFANNDVSTNEPVEIIKTPALPEVDKIPESRSKTGFVLPGGSVNNQKMGFNFHANTQSSVISQSTSIVDTVAQQNKPTFGTSTNNAEPSGVKPNVSPDAKPLGSTSLLKPAMNNNQVKISASNKDDNGKTQKPVNLFGKSESASLTTSSASGIFSFGASTNNSSITNGTPASTPSIFASSSSFQPSGTNTNKLSSTATTAFLPSTATTCSATSSAFSTSASASIFSSGSAVASSTSASVAPTSSFGTSSNGGSIFGFSSPAATSTTNGFQANTLAASTAATQAVPFKFGSGTTGIPSTTSGTSLFSSSAPSFGLSSAVTTSSTTSLFGSGFSSTPSFGLSSTAASSDTKSGSSASGSTTSIFGSTAWQPPQSSAFSSAPFSFGASSTSMPSAASSPTIFGSSNSGASTGSSMFSFSSNSSFPAPVFGNSTPVFGASPTNNNNNDQMSMEDSMADDSTQTPTPSPLVPAIAQASGGTQTPGFMFGSGTPTTPSTVPFQFGGQTNQTQLQTPSQNPFQASGSLQFNAGGSFSLGSGGGDKSDRRILKVKRQNRRK